MNTLLLIEDDEAIAQQIKKHFTSWHIDVQLVKDFEQVMTLFLQMKPSIVIIDIQLPFYDGFHWCREIRKYSNVPIIFLSARDQPLDIIMAMQLGADDYIQKPFNSEVLLSKVHALMRRTYEYSRENDNLHSWNGAIIDYERSLISYENEQQQLTKNEQYILKVLLENKNQIVSRDVLMRRLWDDERFVNDNTLTVNVNRLRTKLRDLGMDSEVIETKKSLGYRAKEMEPGDD